MYVYYNTFGSRSDDLCEKRWGVRSIRPFKMIGKDEGYMLETLNFTFLLRNLN